MFIYKITDSSEPYGDYYLTSDKEYTNEEFEDICCESIQQGYDENTYYLDKNRLVEHLLINHNFKTLKPTNGIDCCGLYDREGNLVCKKLGSEW